MRFEANPAQMGCAERIMSNKIRSRDRQTYPFLMIPKVFFARFNPTWKATVALTALKYYANVDFGGCENISIKTLARIVNVSDKTIQCGLAELESKGVVKIRKRTRKSPEGDSTPLPNLYEMQNLQAVGGEPI